MSTSHDGPDRSDDDVRDLLGAWAVDAVNDVERRAVERLLASDPDAAAEAARLRDAAADLGAAAAAPPPPAVRGAVLAALASTPQVPVRPSAAVPATGPVTAVARRHPGVRRGWWTAAAAAAAVALVAVPGGLAWQQHDRAVRAEARADLLADVLAAPGAQLVRGDVTGGGTAVAVLGPDRAVLLADGLPEVPAGRVYQLWAMRDGVPVPAGLLDERGGTVQRLAEDYRPGDGLAMSVEPAGGSPQPTTTPLVVLLPG